MINAQKLLLSTAVLGSALMLGACSQQAMPETTEPGVETLEVEAPSENEAMMEQDSINNNEVMEKEDAMMDSETGDVIEKDDAMMEK